MPKSRGRLLASAVAAATLLVTLLPLGAEPAGAVAPTDAPTGLSPAGGSSVGGNTQLSWDPVDGAARYRIQIDDTANFSSTLFNVVTYNTTFTPPTALPVGTIYWRVAGLDTGSGQGPWSGEANFVRSMAAPVPSSPADTTVTPIRYPAQPLTFTWSPTPETKSYMLQIDDAAGFPSPTQIVTRTTSHTPLDLEAPGKTYFWRVRSSSSTNGLGITSEWSTTRTFRLAWEWPGGDGGNKPVPLLPAAGGPAVTDVEFEWQPVPGATAYNLEVDPSIEFSNPILRIENSHSNHYVPHNPFGNGAYWWRVQAVDPDGNLGEWSVPQQFTRNWLAAPTLGAPAAGAGPTTGGDLTLTWSSVDHASDYEVQLSTSEFFGTATTCPTVQTRIQVGEGCAFNTTAPFFWRVRALDDGGAIVRPASPRIVGVWSAGRAYAGHTKTLPPGPFVEGSVPTRTAPADCGGCSPWTATPTFSWTPVAGATSYRFHLATDENFTTVLTGTGELLANQTSYTPTEELPDNDAGESYYWYVQACVGTACGPSPLGASPPLDSSTFKKASARVQLLSPAHSPEPETAENPAVEVANFPRFSWLPYLQTTSTNVADPGPATDLEARAYQIQVSRVPTFEDVIDDKIVNQPSYTPWDRTYEEGTIYWRVRAIDGSLNRLAWSQATVESGPSVPRKVIKKSPVPQPSSPANGASGPNSVTLAWAPIHLANGYDVEIYREVVGQPSYSPGNRVLRTITQQAATTTVATLAPGSYKWRVRRSDADGRWGAWSNDSYPAAIGDRSFTVVESSPSLSSPLNNALVAGNDLLFSWTTVPGAATYRFQRSVDAAFTSPQNTTTVMTSLAPTDLWPLGNYYWRVQAFDANDQLMGTSAARVIRKNILPGAPTGVQATRGNLSANLSWTAPTPSTPPGTAITGYRVTPYRNGTAQPTRFFSGTDTSAIVTELVNGETYTFRVQAVNVSGDGALSGFSNPVIPSPGPSLPPGAVYVPITPCRVVDTRGGGVGLGRMVSNQTRDYRVAGSGAQFQDQGGKAGGCGIPDGVAAVEASVTALDQASGGYFRAWPTGEGQPNATFLNYTKGQGTTNTGAIKLAPTGVQDLRVLNVGGPAHYVIDVQGYYADATTTTPTGGTVYVAVTPCRVVDTRAPGAGAFGNGTQRTYKVAGTGLGSQGGSATGCKIPDGATAVEASVTAVDQSANGYFRAWPAGQAMPNATFLNYTKKQGITNTGAITMASGSSSADLTVRNFGSTSHYVIDVQGYFIDASVDTTPKGSVYVPITPCRVVDTRVRGGAIRNNQQRNYQVAGATTAFVNQGGTAGGCGIPTNARSIEASVTSVEQTANGYFRAFPAGTAVPNATFLNYTKGQGITNTGSIKVSVTNANDLSVKNFGGSSHYIIDVQGYFVSLQVGEDPA